MLIEDIIRSRRSFYPAQFSGEKIEEDLLIHLLDLANWAPNHLNTEPWRFKIFADGKLEELMKVLSQIYVESTDPDKIAQSKLEKYKYRAAKLSNVIAIVVEYDEKKRLPRIEESNAVSCAIQNLWLGISATERIRGYWSTGKLIYTKKFSEYLNLKANQECLGLFYLGKLKEDFIEPKSSRNSIQDKIEWLR